LNNVTAVLSRSFHVGKKEDFLSNEANKQSLIQLIIERMRQNGCDVIQAGDDVKIAKAAIGRSTFAFKPTTLIGEDTDLLAFLLNHAEVSNCRALFFSVDKANSYVYNIKVPKQVGPTW